MARYANEYRLNTRRQRKAYLLDRETQKEAVILRALHRVPSPMVDRILARCGTPYSDAHPLRHPVRNEEYLPELQGLIEVAIKKRARFATVDYAEQLHLVALYQAQWVRPLEEWVPKGRSPKSQFRHLVDHLLVKYPVPPFLYACFNQSVRDQVNAMHAAVTPGMGTNSFAWTSVFVALAQGGKRHKVVPSLLCVPLTKKMVNLFLDNKAGTPLQSALRMAQVAAYLEDNRSRARSLHSALMATPLGRGQSMRETFWAEVIHWFTRQSMMDHSEVGPFYDFIQEQKAQDAKWSIKGRNANSLGREVARWHTALTKVRKVQGTKFPESGILPGRWMVPSQKGSDFRWLYVVEEILGTKALAEEGRQMKHCVYSYARSIMSGRCSIWGLRRTLHRVHTHWDAENLKELKTYIPDGGMERLITIEVTNKSRKIVQQQGKMNRRPHSTHVKFVDKWVSERGLCYSSWGRP